MTAPIAIAVQNFVSVPYTPTGNVSKGDVIVAGSLIGVVAKDIAANVQGRLIIDQNYVWSVPKATGAGTGAKLAVGTLVYWDSTNKQGSPTIGIGVQIGKVVIEPADADVNFWVLFRPSFALPDAKWATTAASGATLTAGQATGAKYVSLTCTANGTNTLTTRTATQMFADVPGAQVGQSWRLRLTQTGDNTLTLAAGSGVTINGAATVATDTTRDFVCTFTSATAVTIQTDGVGAIS